MWILHLVPDSLILWFCNLLLAAGVILSVLAFFVQAIPVINRYRMLAQILGLTLLLFGVYFRGGIDVEHSWRERVAEAEARVAQAEQASADANTALARKAAEKQRVIQGRTQIVRQMIDREVVRYDTRFAPGGQCEIPREFVQAHNAAAETPR